MFTQMQLEKLYTCTYTKWALHPIKCTKGHYCFNYVMKISVQQCIHLCLEHETLYAIINQCFWFGLVVIVKQTARYSRDARSICMYLCAMQFEKSKIYNRNTLSARFNSILKCRISTEDKSRGKGDTVENTANL